MPPSPLVSVVVPCYNRAHYLRPTIDSILAQDHPGVECIVVNDGSSDASEDVLRSYGARIRWVSQENRGQSAAVNRGWDLAKGEIVAWLNADDVYAGPDTVSRAVAFLESHQDVDLVYGDCGFLDGEGREAPHDFRPRDWDLGAAVRECDFVLPQPSAFIRRRILDRVGLLDETYKGKMDHELWLRIGLHGRIARLPARLAFVRDIPGVSNKGDRTARECVRLTRAFLDRPDLPPALRDSRFQARARSNAHLMAALYAFPRRNGAHRRLALGHLAQAVRADPVNLPHVALRFLGSQVNTAAPGLVRGARRALGVGARGGIRSRSHQEA